MIRSGLKKYLKKLPRVEYKMLFAVFFLATVAVFFVPNFADAAVTLPHTQHWTTVSPWTQTYSGSVLDTVQSAPSSSSTSLKFTYPSGMFNGTSPDKVWVSWTTEQDEIWVQYWFKYSSNFYFHPIMSKQSYVYTYGPTNTNFFVGLNGSRVFTMQNQRADGGAGTRSGGPAISPDTWYKVTYRAVVNTTDTLTANGIFQLWLNDVLVINVSNVRYTVAGEGDLGYGWSSMSYDPVFGGNTSETKPATDYTWYDYTQIQTTPFSGGTCTPNWQCSSWSTCSSNQQTRTCTDSNNCGTTSSKPATSQSCNVPASCGDGTCNSTETCSTCASDCGSCPVENKPGTASDLSASSVSANSVTLSFTEVDDGTGTPAKYDIRYATPTIAWGSASSVTSGTCSTPVSGATVGSTKTCTVTGLNPDTQYQFQLVPYRGTLNQDAVFGDLSNVVTATTSSGTIPPRTFTLSDFTNLVTDWLKTIFNSPGDVNLDNKVNSKDLGIMMSNWDSGTTPPLAPDPQVCTTDAMQCPDGSFVSRSLPDCEFAVCPTLTPSETCGNGKCGGSETCASCSSDCGQCSSSATLISTSFEDGTHSPFGSPYGGSSVVADSTTPSGAYSLKFTYPAGLYGGVAPDICGKTFASRNEIWGQYWFKYSSNWRWNTITNKQIYVTTGTTNADVNFTIMARTQWGDQMTIATQHNSDSTLNQSFRTFDWTLTKNEWHKVIFHSKMNTAGVKDGTLQMWVDDILRINVSNVLYRRSGQTNGFQGFQITPVYGGGQEQIPETQYMWFDNVVIQTAPFN